MANIAYVSVSTIEQNQQRQLDAMQKHNIDKWYTQKVSAKDTSRPQLNTVLEYSREGDTTYVHDFSRLARGATNLLKLVELPQSKSIHRP